MVNPGGGLSIDTHDSGNSMLYPIKIPLFIRHMGLCVCLYMCIYIYIYTFMNTIACLIFSVNRVTNQNIQIITKRNCYSNCCYYHV